MTKMLIDRAVVEQALEALEESLYATTDKSQFLAFEAITTLRAALVESVQEVDAERKRLLSIAKRRADHEASAAVHHAGRWHAAHEHHLTRHAAMRDLIAAMEESVQEPVTRLFGTLPVYDTPPQRPAEPEYPLGQASTDVGVPVYVVKKAEPQEPCNKSCAPGYCYCAIRGKK